MRILLARGRAEAAADIGRSTDTGTAVLDADRLLNKASYGISNHWVDNNDRRGAGNLIIDFVRKALEGMEKHAQTRDDAPRVTTTGSAPKRLNILIDRPEQRQACAEAIVSFPLPGDASLAAALHPQLPFGASTRAATSIPWPGCPEMATPPE